MFPVNWESVNRRNIRCNKETWAQYSLQERDSIGSICLNRPNIVARKRLNRAQYRCQKETQQAQYNFCDWRESQYAHYRYQNETK